MTGDHRLGQLDSPDVLCHEVRKRAVDVFGAWYCHRLQVTGHHPLGKIDLGVEILIRSRHSFWFLARGIGHGGQIHLRRVEKFLEWKRVCASDQPLGQEHPVPTLLDPPALGGQGRFPQEGEGGARVMALLVGCRAHS